MPTGATTDGALTIVRIVIVSDMNRLAMRFFRKEWLSGELSEMEFDGVSEAYFKYLESLNLPPEVAALSAADIHDALVLSADYDQNNFRFSIKLRVGDLLKGYHDLYISYSDAYVDESSLTMLRQAVNEPKDELLYDEIDRSGVLFEQRWIFASHEEARVLFSTVVSQVAPAIGRFAR